MTEPSQAELVLILAPYGRDAELLIKVLSGGGVRTLGCRDVEALIEAYRAGAAVAIIADESLNGNNIGHLAKVLAEQPTWSDFPVLLLTGGGELTDASRRRLKQLEPLGNLTLVERPLRTSTLLSAVQTALRARKRQYQIRDQMERQRNLATHARENEEKLLFALEAARLGSWELRLPEFELVASSQLRRNFGFQPEEPFSQETWRSAVHPEDLARVMETIDVSFASRTAFETEYRIVRPDGRTAWIFAAGRPVRDGEATGRLVGVTLDITERRKGEEAIRESEAQLRALADSMPQLAWMANRDGFIFWYNRRWYEFTGTTLQEMEGWGWQRVHDPRLLPQVLERWQAAIESGNPFEMEFPLRGASGEFRWFLTQARPVYDSGGEVTRWLGTNTDIHDKIEAERALKESEELARSVIEQSPDCIEVLEADGKSVLVNAAGCAVLGSRVPDSSGDSAWAGTWQGVDASAAREAFEAALGGEFRTFQASGRGGAGGDKRWEVSLTPIRDSDDHVSRILCISRDITARLRVEEELRQTAKLESLGVMAGGIAHDFNNLLTGILGNASMLAETTPASERGMAQDIVLAAERASDLTRQMLAYSGRGRFENRKIDLSNLVRDMLRLVRPALDRTVEIDVHGCRQACYLEGDPGQIQQVIMNLVINAGESMEGNPGTVVVSTGRVRLQSSRPATENAQHQLSPGEYVYLEVVDTGKGMDDATRARIFDPFFTTKFTGRGLGLAAVSGIVRGHNGSLTVLSEPGKGSTFRVLFPSAESPIPERPAIRKTRVQATKEAWILLVDDESLVQRAGAAALTANGYRVELANNGKEAVEVFRQHQEKIDAIILDMTMPVMNGEDALTLIREMDSEVPVIVCSGFNESEVARRFHQRKVNSFMQKPYTASLLIAKVQSVLGSSVSDRAARG